MSTTRSKAQELGEKPVHAWQQSAEHRGTTVVTPLPGMTLRQEYAGRAMQAIMGNDAFMASVTRGAVDLSAIQRAVAAAAVGQADALLAELAGDEEPEKPFWMDELKMRKFEAWADAKGHHIAFGTVEGVYVNAQTAQMFAAWIQAGEPGVEPAVPTSTAIMVENFQRWAISKGYGSEMNFSGVDDRFASAPVQRLFETWKQAGMPEA